MCIRDRVNYAYTVNAGTNPVTVNATGGTATADYADLKQAFDAINSGIHTLAITILINGSTNETVSASLNASGVGASNYTGTVSYTHLDVYKRQVLFWAIITSSLTDHPQCEINSSCRNLTRDPRIQFRADSSHSHLRMRHRS